MSVVTTDQEIASRDAAAGTRERRVLMVSYYFPPAGDVGVHRTLRFIKWLPAFGWRATVLTAAGAKVHNVEPSLLEKVPEGIDVYRTRSFEALNYGTDIDGARVRPLPKWASRLVREIPRDVWKFMAVPDDKIGWTPHAIAQARRLMRAEPFDAVYISGKPFSSFRIGEALHREFGVPWVIDLRDLWTLNRRHLRRPGLRTWLERHLERRFVRRATAVVANTPDNREDFVRAFADQPPEKFVAITNGYDADDFRNLNVDKYDKFTIAYSGSFYFPRVRRPNWYRRLLGLHGRRNELMESYSPRCLFEAVARLLTEQPAWRDRIQIVMSGRGCRKTQKLVDEAGLQENVKLLGWLTYRESLEMLKRSHLQLIVLSRGEESRGWIPSKLFQYLGSGTPLLALAPDGDVKAIVEETQAGVALDPDDVAGTTSELRRRVSGWMAGETAPQPCWPGRERYEARQLTGRLANVLDAVASKVQSL